ncbi:DUF3278 domain-containing protein, partial [Bacillus cereus]|uniref:DUF3278 domain-containing protein n=1 Tax=Bacillus cereus TaxID=1396 RepID=UPI002405E030
MMKIEWKERVYNSFVGTLSERDEYQKQEINKELSVAGIGLWWLNMLVMLIMLLVDTMNHTISIGTIFIFLSNMIYANYLVFKFKKKGLSDTECATKEEYLQHKKKCNYSASSRRLFSFTSLICTFCVNTRYIRQGGGIYVEKTRNSS